MALFRQQQAGSEKCENALKMAASINCTDLSSSQVLTNAIQIFSYYFTENDADECVLPLCEQFFVRKMKTEELKESIGAEKQYQCSAIGCYQRIRGQNPNNSSAIVSPFFILILLCLSFLLRK